MPNSNEITKGINSKSTKTAIKEALDKAILELKKHEEDMFKPSKVIEEAKNKELIKDVDKIIESDILLKKENNFEYLHETTQKAIDNLSKKLVQELEHAEMYLDDTITEYEEIQKAIKLKKEELNNIYGVEEELINLAATVNAHKDKMIELESEYTEKQSKLSNKHFELLNNLEIEKEELFKARKKEDEEYEYNLKRKRKIEQDKYDDDSAKKKKDFTNWMQEESERLDAYRDDLNKKDIELKECENYIKELENKVAAIPEQIEEAVNAAKTKEAEKQKKAYTFEKTILEKGYKADISLLESKLENEEMKSFDLRQQIESLNEKLTITNNQLKELAEKSMDSASNARYIQSLEQITRDFNKKESK